MGTVDIAEQDVAKKEPSQLSPVIKSRTSSTSSGSSKKEMIDAVKLTETSPKDKLEGGPTVPKSDDVKIESKEDIQKIKKTDVKDTFENVTVGVSSFESAKTDLLEEVTFQITTKEAQKMDIEVKTEAIDFAEQDVAEKDGSELNAVTKSWTSSTSSASSKKKRYQ